MFDQRVWSTSQVFRSNGGIVDARTYLEDGLLPDVIWMFNIV